MRTEKDVEAYLGLMNRTFRKVEGEGEARTYLVDSSESMPPIAIRVDPPLIVLRVRITDAKDANMALLRKLLELNVDSLIHSAYGLEKDHVVLVSAHELENLDFNELQAALDEIDLALAQQVPLLSQLSKAEHIADAGPARVPAPGPGPGRAGPAGV